MDRWDVGKLAVVAQENSGGANVVLLGDFVDNLILEQRAASATQWAVRGDVDALLLAEIVDFLLRAQWVVLDLVNGRGDFRLSKQLLQILDGVVGNTNGLDLVGVVLNQLLHALPCLDVSGRVVNVARAILVLGEEGVVS